MSELLAMFPTEVLEYGVYGICAVLLWMNWQVGKAMGRRLDTGAAETRQVIRENSAALRLLGTMLHDRPCLHENGRALAAGDSQVQPAIGAEREP